MEELIARWLCRPSDYKIGRWKVVKRSILWLIVVGVILGILVSVNDGISVVIGAVAVGVLISILCVEYVNRKRRRQWLVEWWHGQHSKWAIWLFL